MKRLIHSKQFILASILLPALLLYAFTIFVPICYSAMQSVTNASSMNTETLYVGFENYRKILFDDKTFWNSILHAVILGLCYIFIQHPIAILSAILICRLKPKAETFFRIVFFLPAVISLVVTTMMWKNIYNQIFGLLNQFLKFIGLARLQTDWLGNPRTAFPALLIMILWQGFGMGFLLYYAGIKRIPGDIYEAARVDGASGFRLAWHITVPLLSPVMRVAMTMGVINALKTMEAVYISTNGGPGDKTQFVANYMYRVAFQNYQWGYANALAITFVLICLAVTLILNHALKRDVGEF